MDGEKIGAFVAARRKALDMTQQQHSRRIRALARFRCAGVMR